MKFKWKVIVDWFVMSRHPQSELLSFDVIAPSATDAVSIAQIRHKLPEQNDNEFQFSWKRIVDVEFLGAAE